SPSAGRRSGAPWRKAWGLRAHAGRSGRDVMTCAPRGCVAYTWVSPCQQRPISSTPIAAVLVRPTHMDGTEYVAPSIWTIARCWTRRHGVPRERPAAWTLLLEPLPHGLPCDVRLGPAGGLHLRQRCLRDGLERVPGRNGRAMLQPDRLASALDAPFVVARARPGKTGCEEILRRQRGQPLGPHALRSDDLADGGRQMGVRAALPHAPAIRPGP